MQDPMLGQHMGVDSRRRVGRTKECHECFIGAIPHFIHNTICSNQGHEVVISVILKRQSERQFSELAFNSDCFSSVSHPGISLREKYNPAQFQGMSQAREMRSCHKNKATNHFHAGSSQIN
ncbi:unnamed protein product [Allacma fusca]|uniref:Uncharacterized protein n=1 Tax=Allacma fusca TaxID=39272 RepID=A0A8J2KMT1_9HEXA|nr:unnamed protein product [Allacma fusca]